MSDLVRKLQAVDHMSVEDCFLQSPLFGQAAAEITRLQKELDTAREDALEEAAKVAESEPELDGDPPREVMDAMIAIGPIGNARASVRATKLNIAKRIRSLKDKEVAG